ncbi:MAG: ParA family protein [Gammaproteobacteria bacterium]|nr:ParA family protein [Gammaproteobacteria bacterium]
MRILATYNLKGGVGKTATAINLAWLAASEGARTIVWDMDPQGAASFYLRTRPKIRGGSKALLKGKREVDEVIKGTDYENLDLLPADFSYRHMDVHLEDTKKPVKRIIRLLRPLRAEYDFIFLDCAPSISTVSETVFKVVDALLIPLIPTTLSLRTFQQIVDFLDKKNLQHVQLLPFFSMVDRRKRMHTDIMTRLPLEWPGMLLSSIPYASDVEKMGIRRSAVGEHAANSVAAQAYRDLWSEIKSRLDIY